MNKVSRISPDAHYEHACCGRDDFQPVQGTQLVGLFAEVLFCIHCGHWWVYTSTVDTRGEEQWGYQHARLLGIEKPERHGR